MVQQGKATLAVGFNYILHSLNFIKMLVDLYLRNFYASLNITEKYKDKWKRKEWTGFLEESFYEGCSTFERQFPMNISSSQCCVFWEKGMLSKQS